MSSGSVIVGPSRTPLLRALVLVAAAALLIPFGEAVLSTWIGTARHATASILGAGGALLLALRDRRRILEATPDRVRLGVFLVAVGAFGHAYSLLLDVWSIAGLMAIVLGAGLLLILHGTRGLRAAAPALWMAAFVVPPPTAIVDLAQAQLTVLVARSAGSLLPALIDGEVRLSGTELLLAGQRVSIVDDCSGLGGIMLAPPFVMLLLFLARVRFGVRWVLVLAISPLLAAAANLLRVLVGAVLVAEGHADQVAHGLIHELLGIVPLLLAGAASWWLVHGIAAREAAR
jgi:exosortase/archaeosortase family protein